MIYYTLSCLAGASLSGVSVAAYDAYHRAGLLYLGESALAHARVLGGVLKQLRSLEGRSKRRQALLVCTCNRARVE